MFLSSLASKNAANNKDKITSASTSGRHVDFLEQMRRGKHFNPPKHC